MSYFTFEHDCSNAPITLTIEVTYEVRQFSGYDYERDYTQITECSFELYCAGIDLTKCILGSNNQKLINEIEAAVDTAIWNNEEIK